MYSLRVTPRASKLIFDKDKMILVSNMTPAKLVVISAILTGARSSRISFPPWLKLGTASSSYQVEGAWNVSDKGESVLDRYMHWPFTPKTPEAIVMGANGDVTTNSYHNWQTDIEMLADMEVDFYRFSIAWPRLLPESFPHYISEDGKKYYNNLIDGLLEKGIEPVVTLYHWELPQKLQDLGGWTNPLISDWFADYARVVYSLYGDRVKTWLTINEPVLVCDGAYSYGLIAPGIVEPVRAVFLCNKHLLLAHAKAWRIYDEQFKPQYGGKVSIANHLLWMKPFSDDDQELTELAWEYVGGRYSHPIFSEEGGWPPAIEEHMRRISLQQGYSESRLPTLTPEEIQLVKGTYDYFSVNHYSVRLVRLERPGDTFGTQFYDGIEDLSVVMELDPAWPLQYAELLALYPEGLREQLAYIKQKYGDIEVFISETGFSSAGDMEDHDRSEFIRSHLEQVLLSIYEDGVNVTGYTYWSLMDSFEWLDGFDMKFGLYSVDFSSPLRTRIPRASAKYYADIIQDRAVEVSVSMGTRKK